MVSDEALRQLDAFTTPGTLLRSAREGMGMSEREAADRLNFMPDYVGILERDEYHELRSPAFARGYVKSYARLLGIDEKEALRLFDEQTQEDAGPRRVETRPLQLQRTGLGVIVGLAVLLVLMVLLWWWQGATRDPFARTLTSDGSEAYLATALFRMVG